MPQHLSLPARRLRGQRCCRLIKISVDTPLIDTNIVHDVNHQQTGYLSLRHPSLIIPTAYTYTYLPTYLPVCLPVLALGPVLARRGQLPDVGRVAVPIVLSWEIGAE